MMAAQRPKMTYRKLRILIALLMLAYALVQLVIVLNQHFDINSILPLKTYRGESYSIGYLQNWQVQGQGDAIQIEPLYTWMNDVIEPQEYSASSLTILTAKATPSTSPAAGVDDKRAWERGFPSYTSVKMPATVIVGGSRWVQQAAIVETPASGGITVTIEAVTVSTIHETTDRSMSLFTMTFATDPTLFDQLNSQVLQPMLRSFVFR
jgi:hypothetical protein